MTNEAQTVLNEIRGKAAAERFFITPHAYDRMRKRNIPLDIRPVDVRNALVNAHSCTKARSGCWKVRGPDLDDDDLDLVVQVDDEVTVITLY